MKTGKKNKSATKLIRERGSIKYLFSIVKEHLEGDHKDSSDTVSISCQIQKDILGLFKVFNHQKENISAIIKNVPETENSLPVKRKVIPITEKYIPDLCNNLLASVKYFQDKLKSIPVSFPRSEDSQGLPLLSMRSSRTYYDNTLYTSKGIAAVMINLPGIVKGFLQKVKESAKSSRLYLKTINISSVNSRGMFISNQYINLDDSGNFNSHPDTHIKHKIKTAHVRRFPVLHISFYMKHGEIEKLIFY